LLGYGLSLRAGVPYETLVRNEITGPLGMGDTAIVLEAPQRQRLIPGHDSKFDPVPAWQFDVVAPAGSIKSTAADMLTYLDANLRPDKYANAPSDPAHTMRAAMAIDHESRG
jgi:D-alanyl-D-alanine-carboxypeptidase/D-alanyl-D-alanine-endopeptidase